MGKREERLNLLSEIATMYFMHSMSQEQIAQRTFLSRSRISRLLQQARDEGIVEVKVNYFTERCTNLENVLESRFKLDEVQVFNTTNVAEEQVHELICRNAAACFERLLKKRMSVGVTRGHTMSTMIEYLNRPRDLALEVVQLMGAEEHSQNAMTAQEIVRNIAAIYNGSAVYIDAPLYVENEFVRSELLKSPILCNALTRAAQTDLIVTSVPCIYPDMPSHVWKGFISDEEFQKILHAGGVGYLLGRAYDLNGNLIEHPVNDRIISADTCSLREKKVMAVAYGKSRGKAMLGALRGKYVSTLITDFYGAEAVLEAL